MRLMLRRVPSYKIICEPVHDGFAYCAPPAELMVYFTARILIEAQISVIYASFIFYKTIILNQFRFCKHTLRLSSPLLSMLV